EWPKSTIPRQDAYGRKEANMAEGTRMLALERGEKVETPPAVWFQGRGDLLHDYKDVEASFPGNEPQRFASNYRKAGGEITLEYIDAERHAGHPPDLSRTGDMFERMVASWPGTSRLIDVLAYAIAAHPPHLVGPIASIDSTAF